MGPVALGRFRDRKIGERLRQPRSVDSSQFLAVCDLGAIGIIGFEKRHSLYLNQPRTEEPNELCYYFCSSHAESSHKVHPWVSRTIAAIATFKFCTHFAVWRQRMNEPLNMLLIRDRPYSWRLVARERHRHQEYKNGRNSEQASNSTARTL